jgi:anti-sigma B factor antagonist
LFSIEPDTSGILILSGRLDASQCALAQAAFDKATNQVSADCSKLEYISSAGLGVLLKTQKRLLSTNGKLRLTGVNPHIRDIFQYSGFDLIVEIELLPD